MLDGAAALNLASELVRQLLAFPHQVHYSQMVFPMKLPRFLADDLFKV